MFDNVTKINYKNEEFDLNGADVNQVLESLRIDRSKIELQVEGDVLYITAKAGTKGAEDVSELISKIQQIMDEHDADFESLSDSIEDYEDDEDDYNEYEHGEYWEDEEDYWGWDDDDDEDEEDEDDDEVSAFLRSLSQSNNEDNEDNEDNEEPTACKRYQYTRKGTLVEMFDGYDVEESIIIHYLLENSIIDRSTDAEIVADKIKVFRANHLSALLGINKDKAKNIIDIITDCVRSANKR